MYQHECVSLRVRLTDCRYHCLVDLLLTHWSTEQSHIFDCPHHSLTCTMDYEAYVKIDIIYTTSSSTPVGGRSRSKAILLVLVKYCTSLPYTAGCTVLEYQAPTDTPTTHSRCFSHPIIFHYTLEYCKRRWSTVRCRRSKWPTSSPPFRSHSP